jgi:hypothetical protein
VAALRSAGGEHAAPSGRLRTGVVSIANIARRPQIHDRTEHVVSAGHVQSLVDVRGT